MELECNNDGAALVERKVILWMEGILSREHEWGNNSDRYLNKLIG